MKKIMEILWIISIVFTVVSGVRAETVPSYINYQGNLTDKDGPVTGKHKLQFKIYTDSSSTDSKYLAWGPQTFSDVNISEGNFNVILGEDDNGKSVVDAFSSATTYLEISVDGGSAISPRQQILSTAYAVRAKYAASTDDARNSLGIVPIGSIIAWHKSLSGTPSLPDGWVECNGQTISDSDSPYNGQTAPSLNANSTYSSRGLFLRGGSSSGTYQNDQLQDHTHTYNKTTSSTDDIDGGYSVARPGNDTNTSGANGANVGTETRPVNMSVVWIMRIK